MFETYPCKGFFQDSAGAAFGDKGNRLEPLSNLGGLRLSQGRSGWQSTSEAVSDYGE
jgi:hypothetical protein